ncbi:MAG: hypothetical protein GX675_01205 [Erysipelotrichaceae bacterium]|nr:hypothetical protein [Erysipelotrichaceae bacterium]
METKKKYRITYRITYKYLDKNEIWAKDITIIGTEEDAKDHVRNLKTNAYVISATYKEVEE